MTSDNASNNESSSYFSNKLGNPANRMGKNSSAGSEQHDLLKSAAGHSVAIAAVTGAVVGSILTMVMRRK